VLSHELADLIVPPSLRDEHRRALAQSVATGEADCLTNAGHLWMDKHSCGHNARRAI
jgi:hypothetical protein